ncbi:MAG: O-methyltransferase [Lachnospiraceae bacterium]|nr:O-methyltransferase [Lachnospiraceae bacterium]
MKERLNAFFDAFSKKLPVKLANLEESARDSGNPIIRSQTRRLLQVLLSMKEPTQILEIGTAVGFSAIWMSECAPKAQITTIEKVEDRIKKAKENFKEYKKEDQITLLAGDASEILKELTGPYDFMFLDAAKAQYIHYLPELLRMLPAGGVLVTDNILQDGELLESRFSIERRDRTIQTRMREYLRTITEDERLQTVLLESGDGVAISVRVK